MIKITFQYYNAKRNKKPPMSDKLFNLIEKCLSKVGANKCHIVHVGTVGDKRHKGRRSHHNHTPPDAIDPTKVYLEWKNGIKIVLIPRDLLAHRKLIANIWKHFGGTAYHVNDKRKKHIHLQV